MAHQEGKSAFPRKDITSFSTSLKLGEQGDTISGDPKKRQFRLSMVKVLSLKVGESFVCTQTLYVSDFSTESHYRKYHPNNKGKLTRRRKFSCLVLTRRRETRDCG